MKSFLDMSSYWAYRKRKYIHDLELYDLSVAIQLMRPIVAPLGMLATAIANCTGVFLTADLDDDEGILESKNELPSSQRSRCLE
jgi:hypothetical protein